MTFVKTPHWGLQQINDAMQRNNDATENLIDTLKIMQRALIIISHGEDKDPINTAYTTLQAIMPFMENIKEIYEAE